MYNLSQATEFFTKLSKDVAGFVLVETSNFMETAQKEATTTAEALSAIGKAKDADELGNLLISYNAGLLQRSVAAVAKSVGRAEAYKTMLQAGHAKTAQA
jgi:hypothetical protein